MAGVGQETRTNILPTLNIPEGPGVMGPDYSFSDGLPLPGQLGVYASDNMESVWNSLSGAQKYVDIIATGETKKIGLRTFLRTGLQCSNGADMWSYENSIPNGGLIAGMAEDTLKALDPLPYAKAVLTSGYPRCKLEERVVGDQDGNIYNSKGALVDNPELVYNTPEGPKQKRWVLDSMISVDEWNKEPKTHCPDGFMKTSHPNNDCSKPINGNEQFRDGPGRVGSAPAGAAALAGAIVIGSLSLLYLLTKKNGR